MTIREIRKYRAKSGTAQLVYDTNTKIYTARVIKKGRIIFSKRTKNERVALREHGINRSNVIFASR